MEEQNATEQEERTLKRMMMEMQLHMKKKDDKAIKSDFNVLKVKPSKLVITGLAALTSIGSDFGTNSKVK